MSLRSGPVAEKTDGVKTDKSFGRLYRIGVTMNLLNPKIIIFFLAFLPPFVAAMGGRPSDVVILGLIFSVQAAVIFSTVSVVGGYASRFLPDSAMEGRAVAVAKAVIYWAIAAYMLIM